MTSDLFTTGAGARAAGSEGVTAGAKGVGNLGEPDPVPMPAEPSPETLDYVTVYDNHNLGGFAGGEPVGKAENFRCAYAKGYQGKPRNISSALLTRRRGAGMISRPLGHCLDDRAPRGRRPPVRRWSGRSSTRSCFYLPPRAGRRRR